MSNKPRNPHPQKPGAPERPKTLNVATRRDFIPACAAKPVRRHAQQVLGVVRYGKHPQVLTVIACKTTNGPGGAKKRQRRTTSARRELPLGYVGRRAEARINMALSAKRAV